MSLDLYFMAVRETTVGNFNITHNLGAMAMKAGIYELLWRPDQHVNTAGDMIEPLSRAIKDMQARPNHYRKFNSSNGWGLYDDFLPWLDMVLECCKNNPDAKVRASI